MPVRSPSVAGMFYPADPADCRAQITEYLSRAVIPDIEGAVLGGIVPHAGWVYSGQTAAQVFAALGAQQAPETVILFGAVHSWGVSSASVYGSGAWRTPLGDLSVDEELAAELVRTSRGAVQDRPEAHLNEHSLEVQLPFIKHLFPTTRIVPIAAPPDRTAIGVGELAAQAATRVGRKAVAIGSTDLTHYGPRYGLAPAGRGARARAWIQQNDARLLDLVLKMRAEEVLDEAAVHWNACGAGAVAATIACVSAWGATRGILLGYTTSHDVMPVGEPGDMVGYGAVVFQ
jgi:AmmeMemoRadiSam system protein B